jgi:hypothetical protein
MHACADMASRQAELVRKQKDEMKKAEDERRIAELAKRAPATNYNELYKHLFHKV